MVFYIFLFQDGWWNWRQLEEAGQPDVHVQLPGEYVNLHVRLWGEHIDLHVELPAEHVHIHLQLPGEHIHVHVKLQDVYYT